MGLNISFIVTTLLYLLLLHFGTSRSKRVLIFSSLWILLISTLSSVGFFQNTEAIPPRFLLVLIGDTIFIWLLYQYLKNTAFDYQKANLIHALRIPVEFVLYFLFLEKLVPEIMTFSGFNFDILMGISGLILFLAYKFFNFKPSKTLLLIWNIIGILFLLNIVVIAILSAPLPFQQLSFEQPNLAVSIFPFVLLPAFIVPVVFFTHIVSIKQLMK